MVYDQMLHQKYVIALGAYVITGGLCIDSPRVDRIIIVDVYAMVSALIRIEHDKSKNRLINYHR
jgi:NADH:ubiquinone oxidoreductase subunit B-like Fe-S oxidoreductase